MAAADCRLSGVPLIRLTATVRRSIGPALVVTSILLPALVLASYATGWTGTDPRPGEWGWFAPAGTSLVHGDLAAVFDDSGVQAGPLQLIPYGLAVQLGVNGQTQWTAWHAACLAAALATYLVAAFPPPSARTLRSLAPMLLTAAVLTLGDILPRGIWGGHPAQVVVPLLWIAAARSAMAGRPFLAGALVGVAASWETWGVLGVVVVLCARRAAPLKSALATLAVLAVAYGPFVATGSFHMFDKAWPISPHSLVDALWPGLGSFPWSLRLLQGGAALALGAIVAVRTRGTWYSIFATILAVLGARLLLDPAIQPYYWFAPAGVLAVVAGRAALNGLYVHAGGAAAIAIWLVTLAPGTWVNGLVLVVLAVAFTATSARTVTPSPDAPPARSRAPARHAAPRPPTRRGAGEAPRGGDGPPRPLGLERREHQLPADAGVLLAHPPVPDAQAERLDRQPGLAQHRQALGQGLAGRVALGGRRQPAQRALAVVVDGQAGELDQREPRLGVAGELLRQGPHREVGRALALLGLVRRRQRVARRGASARVAAHELGERTEGPRVVRVAPERARRRSSWHWRRGRGADVGRRVPTVDADGRRQHEPAEPWEQMPCADHSRTHRHAHACAGVTRLLPIVLLRRRAPTTPQRVVGTPQPTLP